MELREGAEKGGQGDKRDEKSSGVRREWIQEERYKGRKRGR